MIVKAFGFKMFRPWWRTQPKPTAARHLDHTIVFVPEKGCWCAPTGKPLRLDSGTFFWLLPGQQHNFWLSENAPRSTPYYFRFALNKNSRPVCIASRWIKQDHAWELRALFGLLIGELEAQATFYEVRVRGLLLAILSSVLRLKAARNVRIGPTLNSEQRMRILRFAAEHASKRPSPSDLAHELRFSPVYFARVFRNTLGASPRAWLVEQRIRLAAGLLMESNLNVSEVAYRFGYPDVFLFSRQFKNVLGCSPRAYRKRSGAQT